MSGQGSAPRFVVDVMLGRLARWLRLLGYDALYGCRWNDRRLARIAAREARILLTRDRGLLARRIVRRGLLVDADQVGEQLRLVITALGLEPDPALRFSRCTACNTELGEVEPEQVRGLVPPYVLRTQHRFTRCPDCRRIYWRGTQPELAAEQLRRMTGGRSAAAKNEQTSPKSQLDATPDRP